MSEKLKFEKIAINTLTAKLKESVKFIVRENLVRKIDEGSLKKYSEDKLKKLFEDGGELIISLEEIAVKEIEKLYKKSLTEIVEEVSGDLVSYTDKVGEELCAKIKEVVEKSYENKKGENSGSKEADKQ